MCLDRKTPPPEGKEQQRVGYKIMERSSRVPGKVLSLHQGNHIPIPLGYWLDEADYCTMYAPKMLPCNDCITQYPRGWHIYLDDNRPEYSGMESSGWPVEFKDVLAYGIEHPNFTTPIPVVVARYIKILPRPEDSEDED